MKKTNENSKTEIVTYHDQFKPTDGVIPRRKTIVRRPNGSVRVIAHTDENLVVDQSMKDDCDLNILMSKYSHIPMSALTPQYAEEFYESELPPSDLFEATLLVQKASRLFNSLPSKLREKLNNDPTNLPSYLKDPKNHQEAFDLGLVTTRPVQTTTIQTTTNIPVSPETSVPATPEK